MFPLAEILSAQPAKKMVSATEEPASEKTRANQRPETSKFSKMMENLQEKDRAAPEPKTSATPGKPVSDDVANADEPSQESQNSLDADKPGNDKTEQVDETRNTSKREAVDHDFNLQPKPDSLKAPTIETKQIPVAADFGLAPETPQKDDINDPNLAGISVTPDEQTSAETTSVTAAKEAAQKTQIPQNAMSQHLFELNAAQNKIATPETAQSPTEQLMRQPTSNILASASTGTPTFAANPQMAVDTLAKATQLSAESDGDTGDISPNAEVGDADLRPTQTKNAVTPATSNQNTAATALPQFGASISARAVETQTAQFLTDLADNVDPDIFTVTPASAQHSVLGYSNAPTMAPAQQAALAFTGANARTISDALITLRDAGGQIDVALHPEELGRLVFKMETTANGQSVSIFAERPETNEIIRKHMQELQQQLRDMGFGEMTFNFSDGGTAQEDATQNARTQTSMAPPEEATTSHHFTNQSNRTGLDIRI